MTKWNLESKHPRLQTTYLEPSGNFEKNNMLRINYDNEYVQPIHVLGIKQIKVYICIYIYICKHNLIMGPGWLDFWDTNSNHLPCCLKDGKIWKAVGMLAQLTS